MLFAVAEMLHMPVAELMDRMPSSELTEWGILLRLRAEERKKMEAQSRK